LEMMEELRRLRREKAELEKENGVLKSSDILREGIPNSDPGRQLYARLGHCIPGGQCKARVLHCRNQGQHEQPGLKTH